MDAVTGAFSYSGSAIATELIRRGRTVRTMTNHPAGHHGTIPAALSGVSTHPLDLTDPIGLRRSLTGVDTLFNTFWVRFRHGQVTFESAVAASAALFAAAADAGVRRIVHVSITHADPDSRFPYFRGKGLVERQLRDSGVSSAVVRPAILFGGDGVLINNIAWLVRRSPLVLYGGDGNYRVRGIHVRDLAVLMVDLADDEGEVTVDAVGPQSLTFLDLLQRIRYAVRSPALLLPVPGVVFPSVTWALGKLVRDTLLTGEEFRALAAGLADSDAPSTGTIRITDWIDRHAADLGRRYAHELRRHYTPGLIPTDHIVT